MKRILLILYVILPFLGFGQNIFDSRMGHSQYNMPGGSGVLYTYSTPYWYCTGNGYSDYFYAKNCGFNIPANAHINGIQVDVDVIISNLTDSSVQLLKSGVPYGNDGAHRRPIVNAGTISWGDSATLWGASWIPAYFNDSNFGVRILLRDTGGTTPFLWSEANPVYLTVVYDTTHRTEVSSLEPTAIKVSPNPSSRVFELDLGPSSETKCSINVSTLVGQFCKRVENVDGPKYILDLSDFAPGIYVLEVISQTGSFRTKLIRE
jgi:hypothetical protein